MCSNFSEKKEHKGISVTSHSTLCKKWKSAADISQTQNANRICIQPKIVPYKDESAYDFHSDSEKEELLIASVMRKSHREPIISPPSFSHEFGFNSSLLQYSTWRTLMKNLLEKSWQHILNIKNWSALRLASLFSITTILSAFLVRRDVQASVHCAPTPLNRRIVSEMQDILKGYKTTWIGLNKHWSTILAFSLPSIRMNKSRQELRNFDGTQIILDWYFNTMPKPKMSPEDVERVTMTEKFVQNPSVVKDYINSTHSYSQSQFANINPNLSLETVNDAHSENINFEKSNTKEIGSDRLSKSFIESASPFQNNFMMKNSGHQNSKSMPFLHPALLNRKSILPNDAAKPPPLFPSLAFTSRPVLLAVHGVNGDSEESYIKSIMYMARKIGWHGVALNYRGCGDSQLNNIFGYSAGGTQDIELVVEEVRKQFPYSPFFAVGFSLGANMLARYLGEVGPNTPVDAAFLAANPWDLVKCSAEEKGFFTKIYHRLIVILLKSYLRKNLRNNELIKGQLGSTLSPEALSEIIEYSKWPIPDGLMTFDTIVSSRIFGYDNVAEYWEEHSSAKVVDSISIPCFCLNAKNDPLIPLSALPLREMHGNDNLILCQTMAGGHLGWISTFPQFLYKPGWCDHLICRFFQAVLPHIRVKKFVHFLQKKKQMDLLSEEKNISQNESTNVYEIPSQKQDIGSNIDLNLSNVAGIKPEPAESTVPTTNIKNLSEPLSKL